MALYDSTGRKYDERTTNTGVNLKLIVTSRHKKLTPNQLVSVSPPQCQTLLEVGALMWPAAKQVPRSVVHDWTRPVCRKKKAGISLIYCLIRGICQTLSQCYCLSILCPFLPVWWLQAWFAGAEWGELEWPEAQKPPFEQSNLLVLVDWWGFLLGKWTSEV